MSVVRWHAPHIDLIRVSAIVDQEKFLIVVGWLSKEIIFCLLLVQELPEITKPPSYFLHKLYMDFKIAQAFFEILNCIAFIEISLPRNRFKTFSDDAFRFPIEVFKVLGELFDFL
jgi:hypothetical protein